MNLMFLPSSINVASDVLEAVKAEEAPQLDTKSSACHQQQRFQRLYETCPKMPTEDSVDELSDEVIEEIHWDFIVADNLKTLACTHNKVAWNTHWAVLSNNSAPSSINGTLSDHQVREIGKKYAVKELAHYSKAEKLYRLKHYYKMMFVRHPFDRILSAYRDKLVAEMFYGKAGNYYKQLLPIILNRVRPDLLELQIDSVYLPFEDFLRFIEKGGQDRHVTPPYERKCQPCLVKYDYIGKVETFDEDMNYIIDHQFPAKRGKSSRRNKNSFVMSENKGGGFYKELVEYQNTSEELVESMKRIYGRDFVQFGYSVDEVDGRYFATCQDGCC